ncbi:reverse transcriptase domain-containing protein [Xanthobacter tagetidis]|uniref:Reverse transcriptase domain-containing protein n=1 Tax=Xanthobacter tagetidis TaxID=60216 RepID=A0A3L6ZMV1_9HYPH|nr:hypothetical protein D9R14_22725 [Xanthobacter tagetidis]
MVPRDWYSACVVSFYIGKQYRYECSNWRGISLLCVVGKLYGRVLVVQIRNMTEGAIGEEQCGFRRERGCVRHICKKFVEKGKDMFWTFMNLEKAYDRVDRNEMWQVLRCIMWEGGCEKLLCGNSSMCADRQRSE